MNVPLSIFLKVALRTPDVFMGIVRETVRSHVARLWDLRFGDGRARPPRYVDIKLTNRCNLRCKMCGQWGEQGTMHGAPAEVLREELDLETLKGIVDDMGRFRPLFYLWGGEPFLYPDLVPLLDYLNRKRTIVAINTNGTFLKERAKDLVRCRVANLLVSVDGPRQVHDRVRGVPGTFDRVMAGVEQVLAERSAKRAARPYLTFVATVNKENADQFDRVYEIAREMGVDFVGLQFGTFTTEGTGRAYEQRMLSALGCRATSWRGFLSYDSGLDVAAAQETLRRVRGAKHPFGTYFMPDLQPEDLPEYYSGNRPVGGCRSCIVPWMRADLLPNGDVYPCIDFPDYIVGNVRRTPLSQLWNGPRYVAFRRELQRGLLPICGRCQTLYEF